MDDRLGIFLSPRRFDVPFADRMAMIRDAGFGSTCLWWEEERPEIRSLRHLAPDIVRKQGLRLDNIHVPYRWCDDLWSPKDGRRLSSVERHLRWVEDCRRHEIPVLVMHVTMGKRVPPPNALGIDSLRRIVDAAASSGVTVAIENTRSARHLEALFHAIPSSSLGLCFDTSHDVLYADPPLGLLKDWGYRLVATHLSDTDGKRDYHWLPGTGVVDFESIAAHLPDSYAGSFMLEVAPTRRDVSLADYLSKAHESALTVSRLFRNREGLHAASAQPTD